MPPRKPIRKSASSGATTTSATRARALGLMTALGRGRAGVRLLAPGGERRVQVMPTGVDSLDVAIGAGGYPYGRMIILHGGESCIAGRTFVRYAIKDAAGEAINNKGGTVERLWQRFHRMTPPGLGGTSAALVPAGPRFFVASASDEGRIITSEILDVVKTGERECFELITRSGLRIQATADHRFMVEGGYRQLQDLRVGDLVGVHRNTPFRKPTEMRASITNDRKYLYLKGAHPVAGVKTVAGRYTYSRVARARAIAEAQLNGLTLDQFVQRIEGGQLAGLQFLSRDQHVHHKDENHLNDELGNLIVVSATDHGRRHAIERHNDLRFEVTLDEIAEIRPVGVKATYDLKMAGPWHNFVADRFVVHNCGKTTTALIGCAEVQRRGGVAIYADCEHKLDLSYAESLGVDVESLVLLYPDSIERCFKKLSKILRILRGLAVKKPKKGRFEEEPDEDDEDVPVDAEAMGDLAGFDFPIVAVLDSFQSLVAHRTFDADYDKEGYNPESGAWARVLAKFCPELDEMQTILLGISQVRMDLSAQSYGPKKEKVGVGKAPVHHATIVVRWTGRKKIGNLKKGGVIGELHEVFIAKNQIGNPYRVASIPIIFGEGVDKVAATMAAAQATGVLYKSGAQYALDVEGAEDVVVKGQTGFRDLAADQPELFERVRHAIRVRMGSAKVRTVSKEEAEIETLDEP